MLIKNTKNKSLVASRWPWVLVGYLLLAISFIWRAQYGTLSADSGVLLLHGTNLIFSYGIVLTLFVLFSKRKWPTPKIMYGVVGAMVAVNVVVELFIKAGDFYVNTPLGAFGFEKFNTFIPDYGDLIFGIIGTGLAFAYFRFVIMPQSR